MHATLPKERLRHRCFSVNIMKILRRCFLQKHLRECAEFRWPRAIVGLVGVVSSRHPGYFVGPKYFLVGPKFFLVGIYFIGPRFSFESSFVILSSWLNEKKWHRNVSETTYFTSNRFQQL